MRLTADENLRQQARGKRNADFKAGAPVCQQPGRDFSVSFCIAPRFWRLPLVGLEGTVAFLVKEAATSVDAATLLDDSGAGTLVQILAPGSYGEVLTGLLDIPLDAIHPLLEEVGTVSPFGAFPNLPTDDTISAVTKVLPLP